MPRSDLLTDGPELGTAVVMWVNTDEMAGLAPGEAPGPAMQHYWRGLTFDQYDGRGWRNSPLLAESFAAGGGLRSRCPGRRPLRQWVSMERSGDRALDARGRAAGGQPALRAVDAPLTPLSGPGPYLAAMLAAGTRCCR